MFAGGGGPDKDEEAGQQDSYSADPLPERRVRGIIEAAVRPVNGIAKQDGRVRDTAVEPGGLAADAVNQNRKQGDEAAA